jgi:hypothetical protein
MLVTVATYRSVTEDTDTLDILVSARLEDAADRLAELLDRPLAEAQRDELMIPMRDGTVMPRATPIVTPPTGWIADGDRLIAGTLVAWPDPLNPSLPGPTLTYTGGWVERTANPSADNRLPWSIVEDICWHAWHAGQSRRPSTLTAPAGATSVRLGDASVTFGPNGAPGASAVASRYCWSSATMRYRYRPPRGAGRARCW